MSKTYGEVMYEKIKAEVEAKSEAKGRIEGEQRGKAEGTTLGRILALRQTILRQGQKRIGGIEPGVRETLQAIDDAERLERMLDMILDIHSWEELLAVP